MHSLAGFNLADELISRPPYVTLTIQHRLPASSAAVSGLPGLVLSRVPTKESSSLDDSTEAQSIRLRREFIPARRHKGTGVQLLRPHQPEAGWLADDGVGR